MKNFYTFIINLVILYGCNFLFPFCFTNTTIIGVGQAALCCFLFQKITNYLTQLKITHTVKQISFLDFKKTEKITNGYLLVWLICCYISFLLPNVIIPEYNIHPIACIPITILLIVFYPEADDNK